MWHPQFEIACLAWLAGFTGRWPLVDRLAATVADNDLLGAAPFVMILIGFWYCRSAAHRLAARREIFAGVLAAGGAAVISRVVQNAFESARPIWHPAHSVLFPLDFRRLMDASYHSFPSDHVAFFLPLAYTIYRLDARLGVAAGVWFVVLSVVRAYLGLHYPLDLLGGALLGALTLWGVRTFFDRLVDRAVVALRRAEREWPGVTAAGLFLVGYQYATLFTAVRDLGHRGARLLTMWGGW